MVKGFAFVLMGIAITVSCWGMYGPVLHKGQEHLGGSKLKPLICVGISYLLAAVIVPTIILVSRGEFSGGWGFSVITCSLTPGGAGAMGAFGIIIALTSGGKPYVVMPLVFGCAPIVTVAVSMFLSGLNWRDLNPIFLAGLILVSVGAATVLIFQPKAGKKPPEEKPAAVTKADDAADDVKESSLAKAD